jgi:hypothetical protein
MQTFNTTFYEAASELPIGAPFMPSARKELIGL